MLLCLMPGRVSPYRDICLQAVSLYAEADHFHSLSQVSFSSSHSFSTYSFDKTSFIRRSKCAGFRFSLSLLLSPIIVCASDASSLTRYVDSLQLDFSFNPVKAAYWTGFPHHRRIPFAVSPDGNSAYVAYLDSSETDVHVQKLDPKTFAAVGQSVTIKGGKEAGGLVAQNDGFALLTNEALPSGTTNAPAGSTPVPVLYRYTNGQQTWKTFLGGPTVHAADGLSASPDLNGDLVYSASADMYGAYFVVGGTLGSSTVYELTANRLPIIKDGQQATSETPSST